MHRTLPSTLHAEHYWRPACRVGVLLRVMILQHLYGLSDPQAEEQLKDRLSFQKFV
jgi:hypothetical protein